MNQNLFCIFTPQNIPMSATSTVAFLTNPQLCYLNHGSFGACPQSVFDLYQRFQHDLEFSPVEFITRSGQELLNESRARLGDFLNAHADDLVFVPNPTTAMNVVRSNLRLKPGDEILTTDLEYGAMDKMWSKYCKDTGAVYKRANIELPVSSQDQVFENFWKSSSSKTKVIFISTITSSTALRLPYERIVAEAKSRGLITIVDGAHSPGHERVDIKSLDPDFYTGACHKWMMAPKGASFLYAAKRMQSQLDPLIVSWGYDNPAVEISQFIDYFQMTGTNDFSAYLCIPSCIDLLLKNDWLNASVACSEALYRRVPKIANLLHTQPLAPLNREYMGQMVALPIRTPQPQALKKILFEKYKIEVPIMVHGEQVFLRISWHWYNSDKDLDYFEKCLEHLLASPDTMHLIQI